MKSGGTISLIGLIISLSFDIHQNAILYGFGFTALYIYHYRKNILKATGIRWFILGGLLGLAYYFLFIVLPDPQNFIEYYRFTLATTHPMPIMTFNLVELLKSLRSEIGRYRFGDNPMDLVLMVSAIAYLIIRRKWADRLLLVFLSALMVGFVLLIRNKEFTYSILVYPYLLIMVA